MSGSFIHLPIFSLLDTLIRKYSLNISPQFGTASYVGATIWEYENARARAIRALKSPFNGLRDSFKKRRQEMVCAKTN